MKIFEKVKLFRELKNYSQENFSSELSMSQSQLSRRENGEIPFSIEELLKCSRILEVPVTSFLEDNTNYFSVTTQNGGNFGQNITIHDKLIEQYELRIKEKNELISILKSKLN